MSTDVRYIQFEPGAALTDDEVAAFDDAQYRCYWQLIFYLYCNKGRCENNLEKLARMLNKNIDSFREKTWPVIRKKFQVSNGFITHKRVRKELREARKRSQVAKQKALNAAKARWSSNAQALHKQSISKAKVRKGKVSNNIYSLNSKEFRLSELLLDLILARKPNLKVGQSAKKEKTIQAWAVHIDRMIRLDNSTPERIEAVVRWCQTDDFWQNNILSTAKLRKQFDQLEMKMTKVKDPELTPCIVCGAKADTYCLDVNGKPVYLCSICGAAFIAIKPNGSWGYLPKSKIEKIVEQGKQQSKKTKLPASLTTGIGKAVPGGANKQKRLDEQKAEILKEN